MKIVMLIWRMQWKDKDEIKSRNNSAKKPLVVLSIIIIFILISKANKMKETCQILENQR